MRAVSVRAVCSAVLMLCALAGCGGGGSTASTSTSSTTASTVTTPAAVTSNKTAQLYLSGAPQGTVTVGQSYSFTPTVGNLSGMATFTIQNAPGWARFNSSTGTLSGTPHAANAGTYGSIVISVSDGQTTVSLPAFSITVAEPGSGSGNAILSWTAPTTNTDGSLLTNLAGYHIYYGTSPTALNEEVTIANGVTSYVIEGLTTGTWYFAVTSYTSGGAESAPSNIASKTIS